jgi:spermidine synthase
MKKPNLTIIYCLLVLTGAAALLNQVVWQRLLKLYLGGAEASSSALIVFVFLLGLGLGSHLGGRYAWRLLNPLRAFGLLEIGVGVWGLCILIALHFKSAELLTQIVTFSAEAGIKFPIVVCTVAAFVMLPPTILMGASFPFVSEGCQRQLSESNPRVLGRLIAFNTAGSVFGALIAALVLLPRFGQSASLVFAIFLNLFAGILILSSTPGQPGTPAEARQSRTDNVSMFGMATGMLALIYELFIFRSASLIHTPKPHTFAIVLAAFLLLWALGAYMATRLKWSSSQILIGLMFAFLVFTPVFEFLRQEPSKYIGVTALILCIPCLGFGALYSNLISEKANTFGDDAGRFAAWNTAGCCFGVLLYHFVFSALPTTATSFVLVFCSIAIWVSLNFSLKRPSLYFAGFAITQILFIAANVVPPYINRRLGHVQYSGANGVVEVDSQGNLIWDGLWHSQLSFGKSYVGTANWTLAIDPVLAHTGKIENALVIGLGSGVTVHGLAYSKKVSKVRFYEINRNLELLIIDYANNAFNILQNSKVEALWKEARLGLTADATKYDLITQQPLYLSQSGSSFLLSKEYFALLRSRLATDGIVAVYSNAIDSVKQRTLVKNTVRSTFDNVLECHGGYVFLASMGAIQLPDSNNYTFDDELQSDLKIIEADPNDQRRFFGRVLNSCVRLPKLAAPSSIQITDDWPIVEYPEIAEKLVP